MKLKIVIAFLPVFISCCFYSQLANPICGQGYFFKIGGCLTYYSPVSNTLSGTTQTYPGDGLAIAPAFGFSAPDPTYWTVANGVYYYYNGTSFVSSGHSSGGTAFNNPGGSKDYLYNVDKQGNVSVYDGTGNATILANYPALTSTSVVHDIVGDNNNNFYLVRTASPAALLVFDHTGVLTCTYAISGQLPSGANGLAIVNNKLLIGDNSYCTKHELIGNTLYNTGTHQLTPCQTQATDMASCPSEGGLFPTIISSSGALACTLTSMSLSSGDSTGSGSYVWSGPGISGASNSHSVTVTAPGIYTRTAINCAGLSSTMYFKVKYDSTPPPLSFYQAAKIKCAQDPAVMLSANGFFTSYQWSPAVSLSNSTTSVVYANPSVTTTYSVTGQINGCQKTAVLTISASPLPKPIITADSDSICFGNSVSLSVPASLTYIWQPGNLQGAGIVVNPVTNTEYTVTATDKLGCNISGMQKIAVIAVPVLNSVFSKSTICEKDAVTLTSTGAEKYTVMPGNLSGPSLILTPLSATIYTVTGSNWNCFVTKTVAVTVNKLPVISASVENTLVCAGDAISITANGALSYSLDNQPGAQTNVVYPAVSSVYKITGVDENGCNGELMISLQVNECTGVSANVIGAMFKVYPNPAHSFLNIDGQFAESASVEIYDLQGRTLFIGSLEEGSNRLSLPDFEAGLYVVQIKTNTSTIFTTRISIQ